MQLLLFILLSITALATCLHRPRISYFGFTCTLLVAIYSYFYYATDPLAIQLAHWAITFVG